MPRERVRIRRRSGMSRSAAPSAPHAAARTEPAPSGAAYGSGEEARAFAEFVRRRPEFAATRGLDALRVTVVDSRVEEVALAFLCTDGFGRSRVDADGWWRQTGEQLLDFSRRRGLNWIREQLPEWLAEPALVGGDDTTLALLVRSDVSGISRPDLADTVDVP